jgi:hypothetical protein
MEERLVREMDETRRRLASENTDPTSSSSSSSSSSSWAPDLPNEDLAKAEWLHEQSLWRMRKAIYPTLALKKLPRPEKRPRTTELHRNTSLLSREVLPEEVIEKWDPWAGNCTAAGDTGGWADGSEGTSLSDELAELELEKPKEVRDYEASFAAASEERVVWNSEAGREGEEGGGWPMLEVDGEDSGSMAVEPEVDSSRPKNSENTKPFQSQHTSQKTADKTEQKPFPSDPPQTNSWVTISSPQPACADKGLAPANTPLQEIPCIIISSPPPQNNPETLPGNCHGAMGLRPLAVRTNMQNHLLCPDGLGVNTQSNWPFPPERPVPPLRHRRKVHTLRRKLDGKTTRNGEVADEVLKCFQRALQVI